MTYRIHTEIDINAPAARVWSLLTDMDEYQHWNPFVTSARGRVAPGERLEVKPVTWGLKLTFRPVIHRYEQGRSFSWVGKVVHPRLIAGEHIFELEPLSESRTRLIHDEVFSGVALRLAVALVSGRVVRGFDAMNAALKLEAEHPSRHGVNRPAEAL